MASHHHPWIAHTVGNVGCGITSPPLDSTHSRQHRVLHDITAVGEHTRSDDVEHAMTSLPLDSTHGQTTSGVACHHHLWEEHTIERRRPWHDIDALGLHGQSNDVGRGMTSPPLVAHTVERRRAWHAIIALGWKTRANDIRIDMPSPPLDRTHG